MKFFMICILIIFLSNKVFSHAGGTDSNGCHAGSQPYHCHNSNDSGSSSDNSASISVGAWDLNAGYQYRIVDTKFIPYIGASIGKSDKSNETSFGVNMGVKNLNNWYAGYVTTSKSFQVGFKIFHLSMNSDHFGLGISLPLKMINVDQTSLYFGGSALFSGD